MIFGRFVLRYMSPNGYSILSHIFFLLTLFTSIQAQIQHTYPRTGVFHWGGAPADWYARFDLILTVQSSTSFAEAVKKINPKAYVIASVSKSNIVVTRASTCIM